MPRSLRFLPVSWAAMALFLLWHASDTRCGETLPDPMARNTGGEFVDIALQDILEALCEQAGVKASLDRVPEEKRKECLVLQLPALPLESNLFRLLREHGLTWRLVAGTVSFLPGEPARPIREKVAVATHLDEIKDSKSWVRREAFKKLAAYGSGQAVPAMLAILQDPQSPDRTDAMRVLASVGNPQLAIPMLSSREARRREDGLQILALMGKDATPASTQIAAAMNDPEPTVQAAACKAAGATLNPQLVEALIRLLENGPTLVRKEAAWALALIADLRAVEPLVKQLSNEDKDVYGKAAFSLVSLVECWDGDRKQLRAQRIAAVKPFVPELCAAFKKTGDREMARVLGALEDPAAIPVLVEILAQDGHAAPDAAFALGQIKAREAVPALCQALKSKQERTRHSVVGALMMIEDPASVGPLVEYLRTNPKNASAVARTLGPIADASVLPVIKEAKARATSHDNEWEFDEAILKLQERFPNAK